MHYCVWLSKSDAGFRQESQLRLISLSSRRGRGLFFLYVTSNSTRQPLPSRTRIGDWRRGNPFLRGTTAKWSEILAGRFCGAKPSRDTRRRLSQTNATRCCSYATTRRTKASDNAEARQP